MRQREWIPAEFRGLARVFHTRVQAADVRYSAAVGRIIAPLEARLDRKPTVRPGMALDICAAFRAIGHPYRIALDADVPRKGRLTITDIMIGCTEGHDAAWAPDNWERAVAILRATVSTATGGLSLCVTPLATISLHAIARWYQRSGSRDDARLLADLTALLAPHADDRVAVPGGAWLGGIDDAHDHEGRKFRVRQIRTYLHEDQIEDAAERPDIHSSPDRGFAQLSGSPG